MDYYAKNPYSQSVPMDNASKTHRRRYSQVSAYLIGWPDTEKYIFWNYT
jgi:hypothetical protein